MQLSRGVQEQKDFLGDYVTYMFWYTARRLFRRWIHAFASVHEGLGFARVFHAKVDLDPVLIENLDTIFCLLGCRLSLVVWLRLA